ATPASTSWSRARCARSSMRKRSSRTKCGTTWNAATRNLKRRWRKCCVFTAKSRSWVKILKETAVASKKKPSDAVAIISYDEKPGIQAIATTAPDLPPEPGVHAAFARDHEYKRLGTVSLLAGIDLVTGQVHALVKDRHRSREFVEFLQLLDAAYPARTAI